MAVGILLLATSACGRRSGSLVVGLAGPFSEARGRAMLLSAELAVKEINAQGGVKGRPLELRVMDDSTSSARAVAVAVALRDDPRVIAVVGHLTSGTTLAAAAVYNGGADPVVNISPSASSPEVSGVGPSTFRVCADDREHGVALARWAGYAHLNAKTVAVLYQNDDYGRGALAAFTAEYARLGGTVSERDPFLGNTADFTAYLDRIHGRGLARALVIFGARGPAAIALRQARERKLDIPILGGDAMSGIQAEGAIAEGLFISSNWLPDVTTPASRAFVRAYAAANGNEIPDHRGAGAYDAVHLIADAIRDAGTSRKAVRDALARIGHGRDPYSGATGRITFDARGDVPGKSVFIGVIRGGRLVMAEGQ